MSVLIDPAHTVDNLVKDICMYKDHGGQGVRGLGRTNFDMSYIIDTQRDVMLLGDTVRGYSKWNGVYEKHVKLQEPRPSFGLKIPRKCDTRFVSGVTACEGIHERLPSIKSSAYDQGVVSWVNAQSPDVKEKCSVATALLHNDRLWARQELLSQLFNPFVKLLRMLDNKAGANLGKAHKGVMDLYEGLDRLRLAETQPGLVENIKTLFERRLFAYGGMRDPIFSCSRISTPAYMYDSLLDMQIYQDDFEAMVEKLAPALPYDAEAILDSFAEFKTAVQSGQYNLTRDKAFSETQLEKSPTVWYNRYVTRWPPFQAFGIRLANARGTETICEAGFSEQGNQRNDRSYAMHADTLTMRCRVKGNLALKRKYNEPPAENPYWMEDMFDYDNDFSDDEFAAGPSNAGR